MLLKKLKSVRLGTCMILINFLHLLYIAGRRTSLDLCDLRAMPVTEQITTSFLEKTCFLLSIINNIYTFIKLFICIYIL